MVAPREQNPSFDPRPVKDDMFIDNLSKYFSAPEERYVVRTIMGVAVLTKILTGYSLVPV